MKRYSILVRENGYDHERELVQVDTNPLDIVKAAQNLTTRMVVGNKKMNVPRYDHVYARDNTTGLKCS